MKWLTVINIRVVVTLFVLLIAAIWIWLVNREIAIARNLYEEDFIAVEEEFLVQRKVHPELGELLVHFENNQELDFISVEDGWNDWDAAISVTEKIAAMHEIEKSRERLLKRMDTLYNQQRELQFSSLRTFPDIIRALDQSNRDINVHKKEFNRSAKRYNGTIRAFPNDYISMLFRHEPVPFIAIRE